MGLTCNGSLLGGDIRQVDGLKWKNKVDGPGLLNSPKWVLRIKRNGILNVLVSDPSSCMPMLITVLLFLEVERIFCQSSATPPMRSSASVWSP